MKAVPRAEGTEVVLKLEPVEPNRWGAEGSEITISADEILIGAGARRVPAGGGGSARAVGTAGWSVAGD